MNATPSQSDTVRRHLPQRYEDRTVLRDADEGKAVLRRILDEIAAAKRPLIGCDDDDEI